MVKNKKFDFFDKLAERFAKRKLNVVVFTDVEIHVLHDTLVGGGPVGDIEESALKSACDKIELSDNDMHTRKGVGRTFDE